MSDPDQEGGGFLSRWSRRKREATQTAPVTAAAPLPDAVQHAPVTAEAAPASSPPITGAPQGDQTSGDQPLGDPAEPEIDPATLPPLDSIGPGTDISAFLQRGVPKALKNAALRRMWSADPAIRDFREVADYDWDFNAPGYGSLLPTDDVKAMAEKVAEGFRQVVERIEKALPPPPPDPAVTPAPAAAQAEVADVPTATPAAPPQPAIAAVAAPIAPTHVQQEPGPVTPVSATTDSDLPAPGRRRNGGAMPA